MKFNLKALVLAASVIAAPAFAAGGADFDSTVNFSDITAISIDSVSEEANAALADTFDPTAGIYAQNVAMIAQTVDGNWALVDQQGGTGNFATVMQDGTNIANVAVVSQNGNFNRAFVNQH